MKQIASAFVKAKREFGPALKQSLNPHLKNKYANLGACLEAVEDALLNNGIALIQETFDDSAGVTIETVFLHESGEAIRCGKLHVPASKQDAQGYGSALTYARRYSLITACGIAPEDDDGNAAAKKQEPAKLILCGQKEIMQMTVFAEEVNADLPALFTWLSKLSGRTITAFGQIAASEVPHVIKALESKKAKA
jgi:hypothetical protein